MTERAATKVCPRRPNRRGEGSRLRGDIVRAATRLLQEAGDENAVTLRAVARAAGIAAPSIYAHFPNPAAIVGAVVAEAFAALVGAIRASREGIDDPVRRLSAQCDAYLRFAREHPGLYRVLFARSPGTEPPAERSIAAGDGAETAAKDAAIVAAGTPAIMLLVDAIAACAAAGRSASQEPWIDAVALWSMLHGYSVLRISNPEFPWPDERVLVDAMISAQARLRPP